MLGMKERLNRETYDAEFPLITDWKEESSNRERWNERYWWSGEQRILARFCEQVSRTRKG